MLAITLLVLDYILVAPNVYGDFFFGKATILIYWVLQMFFLGGPRIAYRYFRYSRARMKASRNDSAPILILGRAADAEVLLRAIESGAVKKTWPVGVLSQSPADRGQSIRGIRVLGTFDDLETAVSDLANRGTNVRRVVLTPSAFEPDVATDTLLMRARRLGLTTSRLPSLDDSVRSAAAGAGQCRRPAAAAEREDRLPAAGKFHQGPLGRGDRRRRIDRRGNLRSHRHLRRVARCW